MSPDDFVFTDSHGGPLSQESLHKKVWKPTRREAGIADRGQYAIRDTRIPLSSLALPVSRSVLGGE